MLARHLEEELGSVGLGRVGGDISRQSMHAVRVTTIASDEKLIPVGVSKLGGTPHVPEDFGWPCTAKEEPLRFLGQISFADFASFHWTGWKVPLPDQGLLSFFLADHTNITEQEDHVRVLHFPRTTGLMRWDDPFVPASPARRWQGSAIQSYLPRSLAFQAILTLPSIDNLPPSISDLNPREREIYRSYGEELEGSRPRHQILGHASIGMRNPIRVCDEQYRIRTRKCMTHFDGWDSVDSPSRWTPILQLDSDPLLGWSLGPDMYLQFMIRREDLSAADFGNIILV